MFATELNALLERSRSGKTGLIFHFHGSSVSGVVREVFPDAVVISNQEFARILVRLDQVTAVAGH